MAIAPVPVLPGTAAYQLDGSRESHSSAVSWAAVFAGAFVATAVTIMLLALGSGIGLASASPYSYNNPSAATFTAMAAVWLIIVQWVASAFGGYMTGRLRTRWTSIHTHEVFFRDTANGLLTWAVATVFIVGLMVSGASSLLSGGTHAAASVASGAAVGASQGAASSMPSGYMIDTLFRSTQPNSSSSASDAKEEATRILAHGLIGSFDSADRTYLAEQVSARTGLSQVDAEKRVATIIAQEQAAVEKAKQTANAARKAASSFAFYTFFSMLIGAFIASVAGALGGRLRDDHI
jgi:hypothetical protein